MNTLLQSVKPVNLLQTTRELRRYTLLAVDGEIGSVEAFYFDDMTWAVRYLVVNTGSWLMGRRVLISPVAVGEVREDDRTLCIELTRKQIEGSPPVSADREVSRQYEIEYYKYYNWPPYWEPGSLSGFPPSQTTAKHSDSPTGRGEETGSQQMHLRSTKEVRGYAIAARDGAIGHVQDFVIDNKYWVIRYLEIDTRNWWPGKHVLVNPGWIERVTWPDRTVSVDVTRDVIKSAPEFDPSKLISRDYEVQLFKHYRRQVYWERDSRTS
jgi:hypothetical protein